MKKKTILSLIAITFTLFTLSTFSEFKSLQQANKTYCGLDSFSSKWCEPLEDRKVDKTTKGRIIIVEKPEYMKYHPVEWIIRSTAREQGFVDEDLLVRIAWSESRFRPEIDGEIDPDDKGLFQFNIRWHKDGVDKLKDPVYATKKIIEEIRMGNLWKWNSSKFAWNK